MFEQKKLRFNKKKMNETSTVFFFLQSLIAERGGGENSVRKFFDTLLDTDTKKTHKKSFFSPLSGTKPPLQSIFLQGEQKGVFLRLSVHFFRQVGDGGWPGKKKREISYFFLWRFFLGGEVRGVKREREIVNLFSANLFLRGEK